MQLWATIKHITGVQGAPDLAISFNVISIITLANLEDCCENGGGNFSWGGGDNGDVI